MKIKKFIFSLIIFAFINPFLNSYQFKNQEISLRITPMSINFPSENPDLVPVIPADSQLFIEIKIDGNTGKTWQLTVLANGNLRGPKKSSIPIKNVNWTATPSPPFINGTLNKKKPQLVANGQGNVDLYGQLNFYLKNSWDYQAGEYNQTITFTLAFL